jgi:hypothetical protein
MPASSGKKNVAIAVPVYRENLTPDEKISWRHLNHYLGHYDRFLVLPQGLDFSHPPFREIRFPRACFQSRRDYSRLLLSREFYEAFQEYEYLLIYQLDCLVLADRLRDWCAAGLDYIGAPLFASRTDPLQGTPRVGNGGFSLRRVAGFLQVLKSCRPDPSPGAWLKHAWNDLNDRPRGRRWLKKIKIWRESRKGGGWYAALYTLNEDLFWSDRARLFDHRFRVASVPEALDFAFEAHPRHCFELNGAKLPFGCHAWPRWDRAFWEPFLLPE